MAFLRGLRRTARGRWVVFVTAGILFAALILAAGEASGPWLAAAIGLALLLTAALALPSPAASRPLAPSPPRAPNDDDHGDRRVRTLFGIVESSLPILRTGLGPASAGDLVRVLFRALDFDAIAITDTERILAFEGVGAEHHLAGDPVATEATRTALRDLHVAVASDPGEISCVHPGCRLACGVIAPLVVSGKAAGTIKFYRVVRGTISEEDRTLAEGLSHLLSTQLELNEIEVQRQMAIEAKMRALKAQIHPHFIFNVLNTISSACVVDPQVARTVVLRLSSLLRRTFRIRTEFITLQEELALVREYLEIESIRFPDVISYHEEVDSETMRCLVPVLILQPLVENCIIHGLQGSHIRIIIRARLAEQRLQIEVEDDGRGLGDSELAALLDESNDLSEGVGIRTTRRRLQALTGEQGSLTVESGDPGLRLIVSLPATRTELDTHMRRDLAHADGPHR
ncbi:MAG: sensor histidine kinase [Thermoleophilia bacterium]